MNVPASVSTGIPLTVSNAAGITSLTVDIDYNPALLTITSASTSVAGASETLTFPQSGVARLTFTSPTPLAAALNKDLIDIRANVPASAASAYRQAQILRLANLSVNGGAIGSLPDDALQTVAYAGDAQGTLLSSDGHGGYEINSYSLQDALAVLKVAVAVDSGFAAYPLVDPLVVGGVTGGPAVGLFDARDILKAAVGLSTSDIPPLPTALAATLDIRRACRRRGLFPALFRRPRRRAPAMPHSASAVCRRRRVVKLPSRSRSATAATISPAPIRCKRFKRL